MKGVLWFFAAISAFIFLKYFFIPYIKRQIVFRRAKRKIKEIEKKHEGTETGEQLKKLGDLFDKAIKEDEI